MRNNMDDLFTVEGGKLRLVPREYQSANLDTTLALWDKGHVGAMTRSFTGSGKTPMACMVMAKWLLRGPLYQVLVVSYETQLVWQFAQEIEDFLGITPGIEMEKEAVAPDRVPRIVVACRASLLRSPEPEQDQRDELRLLGLDDIGACDKRSCKKIIRAMRKGCDLDVIKDQVREFNERPEVANGFYSRVHKFDWRKNWLVVFDEAHRHAKSLVSVGHIVDWFEQNPNHRRYGMTATPKRSDGISVGHTMFPGIALDYPLYSAVKPCGVKDGWAVPYVQKYIEVEGVDFKNLKKIAGDFDPDELERVLGQEGTLAKLIEPLLDMVGDRRTLIFSPGVEMAKNVALYINARAPVDCPHCSKRKWYPIKLVGDGAQCPCGKLIEPGWVIRSGQQAEAVWGAFSPIDRKEIYRGHQTGKFQFLSVCGLCREGYNDPDISCVAVFRPISKKASSLAEQVKGRGCRPLRSLVPLLNATKDAAERCRLIAESAKPNCLIVDLVGITGLADCASTVQIYSEGLPDEIVEKAEQILAEQGMEEETGVEDAIEEAKRLCEEEKERLRLEREATDKRLKEEFETRAKADAEVKYTAHDAGTGRQVDPRGASENQINFIEFLGMALHGFTPSKNQAGRMIGFLRLRKPLEEVAKLCWLHQGQWSAKGPSVKQVQMLNWKRIPHANVASGYDASQLIGARVNPVGFEEKKLAEIAKARDGDELTAIALDILMVRGVLPADRYQRLVAAGKAKRYGWRGDAAE
jgi:superfamily II DNA or RNA helicase